MIVCDCGQMLDKLTNFNSVNKIVTCPKCKKEYIVHYEINPYKKQGFFYLEPKEVR